MKKNRGFTLIELLIVIGIIAILAAIIYVAVDPARRLSEARNAERWSSVNAVLNAILKYTVDNSGTLPPTMTSLNTGTYVVGEGVTCSTCAATSTTGASPCLNLNTDVVPNYLSSIPGDPSSGQTDVDTDGIFEDTRYYVYRSGSGRITVGSCAPETVGGTAPSISVSR